jgi:hypothetical protein
MPGFIRVRAASGPKHEYDAPVDEVEANPDLYVVVDKEPVAMPRAVDYKTPPASKPKAIKSVGESKEGDA